MSFVRESRTAGFRINFADVYSGMSLAELANMQQSGVTARTDFSEDSVATQARLTDFRAHCINTTFHPSQTLVYKYKIEFRGQFDPSRLKRAWEIVVKNADSLRLRFIVDEMAQSKPLETMSDSTAEGSKIAQPVMAKVTTDGHHVLISLRIHHAVFDCTSWALMLEDLATAYARDYLPDARLSFWTYLNDRLLHLPSTAMDYWGRLLAGSSPTLLRVPKTSLTVRDGPFTDTSRYGIVPLSTHPPAGATMSTLIKGARAVLLSYMANRRDTIFEYLVNGRDENVAGSQNVIGCCVTNIPCRIELEEHMTGEDLLSLIGRQILDSIANANVGSATTARKCADWGVSGNIYHYSSWLLQMNIDVHKSIGVGDAGYMDVPEPDFGGEVVSDFALITTTLGSRAVKILLLTHSSLYSPLEVQAVGTAILFCLDVLLVGRDVGWIIRKLDEMDGLPRAQPEPERM